MGEGVIVIQVIKLWGSLKYRKKFFIQHLCLTILLFIKISMRHLELVLVILTLQYLTEFGTGYQGNQNNNKKG
jgi:hypothetical protein